MDGLDDLPLRGPGDDTGGANSRNGAEPPILDSPGETAQELETGNGSPAHPDDVNSRDGAEPPIFDFPGEPAQELETGNGSPAHPDDVSSRDGAEPQIFDFPGEPARADGERIRLGLSIHHALKTDPDLAAKVLDLSRRAGLPPDVVERNYDRVERDQRWRELDLDALCKTSPATAAFLADKDQAAVAHDSIPEMSAVETILRRMAAGVAGVADNLTTVNPQDIALAFNHEIVDGVGTALIGIGELLESAQYYMDRATSLTPGSFEHKNTTPEYIQWPINPAEIFKIPGEQIKHWSTFIKPDKENVLTDIAGEVGKLTLVISVSLINPASGIAMTVGQGAGQQAERADKEGATEEEKAAAVAIGATITALTEKLGLKAFLERIPSTIKNRILRRLADIGIAGGIKAAQTAIEGTLHNLTALGIYDPDAKIFPGLGREATTGTIEGAVKSRQAAKQKEAWKALGKAQAANKLRTRMPELERRRIRGIVGETGIDTVYVDHKVLKYLYDSGGLDGVLKTMDDGEKAALKREMEAADAHGGFVAVSFDTFAARIAGIEGFNALIDDVKLGEDNFTVNEGKKFESEIQDIVEAELKDARKAAEADAQRLDAVDKIGETVRRQSVSAGNTPEAAREHAALHRGRARVIQSYGIDPTPFRRGTENQKALPDALQKPVAEGPFKQDGPGPAVNPFTSTDKSTVLQESGRSFVDMMEKIAAMEGAPERAKGDFAALLGFVGAERASDLDPGRDGKAARAKQEKLARSFETYLSEGKAPSVELRSAFDTFRTWMIAAYKDIEGRAMWGGTGLRINDDLHRVFERMLATEEEIGAAERYTAFGLPADLAGLMTEKELKAHAEAERAARAAAVSDLETRKITEQAREDQAWWKDELKTIRADIEREYAARPVYAALDMLRGKALDTKLSRAAIVELRGEEVLKLLPKGIYRSEGGVDPDHLAAKVGLASGNELITALIKAAPNKQARARSILDEARARMAAHHGDLRHDPLQAAKAAIEAVHGEQRGLTIEAELSALARKAGTRPATARAAKAAARRMIAAQTVETAGQANRYHIQSVRFARNARAALARKDYQAAADAKQKQLLNHYLFIEARKVQGDAGKTMAYFRTFDGPAQRREKTPFARHER